MDRLVSLQAAIDALGEEPEVWTGNDEYAQGLNNQWHYDVNALKAVPSAQPEHSEGLYVDGFNDGYRERMSDEPQWIPCSERLPSARQSVILSTKEWTGEGCYWETTEHHVIWKGYRWNATYWDDEVTAWMPLPEPYDNFSDHMNPSTT